MPEETEMESTDYVRIAEQELPRSLVWVTPGRHAGQVVEISYSRGIPAGSGSNMEADEGDPYKREIDSATGQTWYWHQRAKGRQ